MKDQNNTPATQEDVKTQQLKSVTQSEILSEETLDTLNTLDECNKLLMGQMKEISKNSEKFHDASTVKNMTSCAKEIRGMLRLKLDTAKFLKEVVEGN